MSAFVFDVTFDGRDPERLSGFWAALTGYEQTELRVRLRPAARARPPAATSRRALPRMRSTGCDGWVTMADPVDNEFCIG